MSEKYFYILKTNDLPNHLVIDVIEDLQMLDVRLDGLSGVKNANKFLIFWGGPIQGNPYSYYRDMRSGCGGMIDDLLSIASGNVDGFFDTEFCKYRESFLPKNFYKISLKDALKILNKHWGHEVGRMHTFFYAKNPEDERLLFTLILEELGWDTNQRTYCPHCGAIYKNSLNGLNAVWCKKCDFMWVEDANGWNREYSYGHKSIFGDSGLSLEKRKP